MTEVTPLTRRQIEEKIVALAWKDDDFREKFLADPKAQFEERLSTKLPEGLVMTAHAEDENHLYFVIPAKPKVDLDELSDADLEKVAGGIDVAITVILGLTTAAITATTAEFVISAVAQSEEGW